MAGALDLDKGCTVEELLRGCIEAFGEWRGGEWRGGGGATPNAQGPSRGLPALPPQPAASLGEPTILGLEGLGGGMSTMISPHPQAARGGRGGHTASDPQATVSPGIGRNWLSPAWELFPADGVGGLLIWCRGAPSLPSTQEMTSGFLTQRTQAPSAQLVPLRTMGWAQPGAPSSSARDPASPPPHPFCFASWIQGSGKTGDVGTGLWGGSGTPAAGSEVNLLLPATPPTLR